MRADVVVVGAGIVGASCAYSLVNAGLSVIVVDRGGVAAGTSGSGEGNVLLSDKQPGPELELSLRSTALWRHYGDVIGGSTFEMEEKGGVVVAESSEALEALVELSALQAGCGITSTVVDGHGLLDLEPHFARDLAGGAFYPQDIQVQPMLATAQILSAARRGGADIALGVDVLGPHLSGSRLAGVATTQGPISAEWVVNAAGTWGQELSGRLGAEVPVAPRRGLILVTEPLPHVIHHKVCAASYVASVVSSAADLLIATVVEGTQSGPVLVGSSRERVGYRREPSVAVLQRMAREAVRVFPILARVKAIRAYAGFRPYSPDHLPIIGLDPRLAGLAHACGHEGSGIALGPATGEMIAALITGTTPPIDAEPFSPSRFAGAG